MLCPKVPCVLLTLALLTAHPSAFSEDSWAGKKVMMKEGGVKIGRTSPEGEQIITGKITSAVVTVLAEKDGWLKVRVNGKEGWFDKEKAMLLSEAVDYYTDRIRADATNSDNYLRRGIAWGERGEHEIAIKDYTEAIRLDPKGSAAYNNRGVSWEAKKDFDKAIKDYTEAIRLDPKAATTYRSRGRAYNAKKDYDKAIEDYTAAIRFDSRYASAYNSRGISYKCKKEYDKAIKDYREAIRLDPNSSYAYNNLAWILATCPKGEVRDGKQAIEYATKACKLSEWKNADQLGTLAVAYAESGDFKEAMKRVQQAIALGFEDKEDLEEVRQHLKMFQDGKPWRDK